MLPKAPAGGVLLLLLLLFINEEDGWEVVKVRV